MSCHPVSICAALFAVVALTAPARAACDVPGAAQLLRGQAGQLPDRALLEDALSSLRAKGCAEGRLPRALVLVDYGRPSTQPRLHIIELATGLGISSPIHVAHGRGSDLDHDGIADRFSNQPDSHASSIGAFRGAEEYVGKHGRSLRLDGLDPSNDKARARAIVVHAFKPGQFDYVSGALAAGKPLGRSFGCFVVTPTMLDRVLTSLRDGGFLYAGRSTPVRYAERAGD